MKHGMWKFALGSVLYIGLSTQASANEWLISLGYSSTPSETIDEQYYSSSVNANAWFGVPQAINSYQGVYLSASLPEDVWNSRSHREVNSYTQVNVGMSFSPSEYVTLYAGPGLSYQRTRPGADFDSRHRYRLNANVGAIVRFGNFGVNFSYDVIPQAFGIGLLVSSSAFQ